MANKVPSIVPSGSSQYLTPSLSFNRWATDFITPGIVGALTNTSGVSPATGAMAVNAQGTPNMTVAVTGGVCYVSATPSGGTAQTFGVTQDASENVTISANSTGSTVYDFIYMKLDATKLNTPGTAATDVATLTTSRSTTAYSATATANGNSNGAQANTLLLAVVTVVNGASSIANSAITDARLTAGPTPARVPYKFSAYSTVAQNTGNGAFAKTNFATEEYDTGSNYDTSTSTFTAPMTGYYHFDGHVGTSDPNTLFIVSLFKNGSEFKRGNDIRVAAPIVGGGVSTTIYLVSGDTIDIRTFGSAAIAIDVTQANCYFQGYLVSAV